MNISKREKTLILILLIFAVFCLYYFFFLKPHLDDMGDINRRIADNETQVLANRQLKSTQEALDAKISAQLEQLEALSGGITQGFDQPPLLVYLDQTIREHGTKITYLFSGLNQMGELYVCPVTVTLTADYDGIKKILSAFAQGEYFVKVTGLAVTAFDPVEASIEPQDEGEEEEADETEPAAADANALNVSLQLEFYSLLGDITPGANYAFSEGFQYGTQVFR